MEFLIRFEDSSEIWLPFSRDIADTVSFESYCRTNFELHPLLFPANAAKQWIKELNARPITEVVPGDTVFVNLQSYGATWYQSLQLPFRSGQRYVISYTYGPFINKSKLKIRCSNVIFDETFVVDHHFVFAYGQVKTFNSSFMVLIDAKFVLEFPQVLPDKSRAEILARHQHLK
jgi:hypothetical protein